MDDKDLFWLAGLLEGEGSFLKPPPSEPNRPRISLEMVDEDVIQRAAQLFGLTYYMRNENKHHEAWKPTFKIAFRGKRATETMHQLYPLMSPRRQNQIEVAINEKIAPTCDLDFPNWFFWLVGLLEGEGSFQRSVPSKQNQPCIQLHMTDRDVIERAASLMNVKPTQAYEQKHVDGDYKAHSYVFVRGRYAVDLMTELYPYMSIRRQAQIDSVMDTYQPIGQVRGERHPQSKLTARQVHEIKQRLASGEMGAQLAREYKVDKGLIWQIKVGRIWQHVE